MQRFVRPSFDYFKSKRIYKSLSTGELIIDLAVLKSCQFDYLVDNATSHYERSCKILGANLTNSLLLKTYGTKFVAGVDAEGLRRSVSRANANGMGIVVYYLAESLDGKVFGESVGSFQLGL